VGDWSSDVCSSDLGFFPGGFTSGNVNLTIHLHAMKRRRMSGALANGANNRSSSSPKIISDVNPRSPDTDPECCLLSEEVTAVRKNSQKSSVFRISEGFLRRGVCGGPICALG
jgi:hypothetical protein